ncbi:MAG: hypothetical protein F6K19_40995 [Cyanothece sp. SIO1E1]|nr:hypothetical protein [Cyanothece sp. SIO1E1]
MLAKEVERFIVFKEVENEKEAFKKHFIKALSKRGIVDRFVEESDKFSVDTIKKNFISWEELSDLVLTQLNLYYSDLTPFRMKKGITPLDDAKYYLDFFYNIVSSKINAELQERAKKVKKPRGTNKDRLRVASKIPSIYFTRRLYQSWLYNVNKGHRDGFKNFRAAYDKFHDRIPRNDSQILWTYMLNECSRRYQQGQVKMLSELLSLYQFGHRHELLTHEGTITETKFANILTVAVAEQDIDFAEIIWNKYGNALPNDSIIEGTTWAKAYIFGYRKKYGTAIALIDQQTFNNGVFKPRSKVLRIQCIFEQFLLREIDLDELVRACTAFERQMKTHYHLNETRSTAYLKFSKYLKKVARRFNDPNHQIEQIEKIGHEVRSSTGIQVKKWLLDKIDYILEKGR